MPQPRLTVENARQEGIEAARFFMQNGMPKRMQQVQFEQQGIGYAMRRTRGLSNATAGAICRELEAGWNSVWAERPADAEIAPLFIKTVQPGETVFLLDTWHGEGRDVLKHVEIIRKTAKTIWVRGYDRNTFDENGMENQPGTFNKCAQLLHSTPELEERYLRQSLLDKMHEIDFSALTTDQLFDIYRVVNPNLAAAIAKN